MPDQGAQLGKTLLAVRARVGALDVVNLQVVQPEGCQIGEYFLTHGALHGEHQHVDLLVAGKLVGVGEAAATLGASQRVIAPVAALVFAQIVQRPEDLLTLGALVPPLGGLVGLAVRSHMSLKVGQEREFFTTCTTDEGSLGRDDSLWLGGGLSAGILLVLLQVKRVTETLATL